MRYEQTKALLQHLIPEYHRTVGRYYQALAEDEVSPRVRLMLDYLIDHELHRALALGEFCRNASSHVLEHWFKGVEISFPTARPETIDAAAKSDLDQLIKSAVAYKVNLILYFTHLLEHCSEKEAHHLFLTLKNQEEKALKRMVRHAQGLADL